MRRIKGYKDDLYIVRDGDVITYRDSKGESIKGYYSPTMEDWEARVRVIGAVVEQGMWLRGVWHAKKEPCTTKVGICKDALPLLEKPEEVVRRVMDIYPDGWHEGWYKVQSKEGTYHQMDSDGVSDGEIHERDFNEALDKRGAKIEYGYLLKGVWYPCIVYLSIPLYCSEEDSPALATDIPSEDNEYMRRYKCNATADKMDKSYVGDMYFVLCGNKYTLRNFRGEVCNVLEKSSYFEHIFYGCNSNCIIEYGKWVDGVWSDYCDSTSTEVSTSKIKDSIAFEIGKSYDEVTPSDIYRLITVKNELLDSLYSDVGLMRSMLSQYNKVQCFNYKESRDVNASVKYGLSFNIEEFVELIKYWEDFNFQAGKCLYKKVHPAH